MKEGIYVFGGKNVKGEPTNTFMNIQLGANPVRISHFRTVGIPPRARFGHSAHFLPGLDYYVIYGGRNDQMYTTFGSSALSDVVILNLKYLAWCSVKFGSINPGPCYNFSSESFGTRIFKFGGVNNSSYVSGKMYILELDQTRAFELNKLQKKLKRQQKEKSKSKKPNTKILELLAHGISAVNSKFSLSQKPYHL